MDNVERFRACLSGGKLDRLPMIEWASWWDKTVDVWRAEGLPQMDGDALRAYFGDDPLKQFWLPTMDEGCPPPPGEGLGIIENEDDYDRIRPYLFTDALLNRIEDEISSYAARAKPDMAYWFSLDGFFWFPRKLFGIENHLMAFYDEPELMLRINRDLCDYHKKCLHVIFKHIKPVFMTFAEDMSYNLGPMLSRDMFNRFILPFYLECTPIIRENGCRALIDTDGQVEPLIPWFIPGGIEGVLPLERMAGVDVNRIRAHFPDWIMIGGFDKTVMHRSESAVRAEFERLLPAMRSGKFIPSVDHQTPPDVTIADYQTYRRLLREYAQKAAEA